MLKVIALLLLMILLTLMFGGAAVLNAMSTIVLMFAVLAEHFFTKYGVPLFWVAILGGVGAAFHTLNAITEPKLRLQEARMPSDPEYGEKRKRRRRAIDKWTIGIVLGVLGLIFVAIPLVAHDFSSALFFGVLWSLLAIGLWRYLANQSRL